MPRDKKTVSLRPVEEKATEETPRVLHLHKDNVEVNDGKKQLRRIEPEDEPHARLEVADKADLKVRSAQADATEVNLGSAESIVANPEEEWTGAGARRRIPLGWVFLIIAIFASAVIWSLVQVGESVERQGDFQVEVQNAIDQEEQEKIEARRVLAKLEETTEAFYAAGSIEEMLPLVRHPSRVRPLMEDHYSRYPLDQHDLKTISAIKPISLGKYGGFWIVETKQDSDEDGSLLIEVTSDGEALVDWESRVRYQPMEWEDFVNERPEGYTGDFRVNVANDNFFSYEFSDSEKYECFRLSIIGSDEVLYGYALRGSEKEERIKELIERHSKGRAPMILRLHIPENLKSRNSVLINEVVAPRWMFVESPDENTQ